MAKAKEKLKPLDPVAGFDNPVKRQENLPGMESRGIPEIEEACRKYAAIRDRRMALSIQEGNQKALVLALLKKHDKREYNYHGITAEIVPEGETVKVRVEPEEAGKEATNGEASKRSRPSVVRSGKDAAAGERATDSESGSARNEGEATQSEATTEAGKAAGAAAAGSADDF